MIIQIFIYHFNMNYLYIAVIKYYIFFNFILLHIMISLKIFSKIYTLPIIESYIYCIFIYIYKITYFIIMNITWYKPKILLYEIFIIHIYKNSTIVKYIYIFFVSISHVCCYLIILNINYIYNIIFFKFLFMQIN